MDYLELIEKYLLDETSTFENERLISWIQESSEHKKQFTDTCNIWHISNKSATSFCAEKAYSAFKYRIETENKPNNVINLQSARPEKNLMLKIAVSVAAVILLAAGVFYLNKPSPKQCTYANISTAVKSITLSDGSVVYLNKSASISTTEKYSGKTRPVTLKGEAYFEIAKNKEKPFIISIGNASITVVGTSFNVAYDTINMVCSVIVNTGIVKLMSHTNKQVLLKQGEIGTVDMKTNVVLESKNKDCNYLSWKTGILSFNDTKLSDVITTIKRHYGIEILAPKNTDSSMALTAKFDHESLESVLKVVELTFNIKFEKQNTIFVLKN